MSHTAARFTTHPLPRLAARWAAACAVLVALVALAAPARAFEIQEVRSPGGITAWLVQDDTVPIIAMDFAFDGGAAADPQDKVGLANFLSGMLDEGAGDMTSEAFQTRLEELAVKLSFNADRDNFSGSLQTLSRNRDEAFGLLKVALTEPRFDAQPLERVRNQILVGLKRAAEDPHQIANAAWMRQALGDHPYARDPDGTQETVAAISADDLRALSSRLFARDALTVAVVGDIDAATLGRLLDETFGALPETSGMPEIAEATVSGKGAVEVVNRDIPQSVIQFGARGLKRDDPDFVPAYVMNFVLGGGGFGSRLIEEVREKRGLSYSVYSYIYPLDHAGLFVGGAATRNDRARETIDILRKEIARMAKDGPSETELEEAKTYLTGSYPLRFDTNTKIAGELLGIQLEDLGIDYVENRNAMIEAVTIDDVRRVARELLKPDALIFSVVGQPQGVTSSEPEPADATKG